MVKIKVLKSREKYVQYSKPFLSWTNSTEEFRLMDLDTYIFGESEDSEENIPDNLFEIRG